MISKILRILFILSYFYIEWQIRLFNEKILTNLAQHNSTTSELNLFQTYALKFENFLSQKRKFQDSKHERGPESGILVLSLFETYKGLKNAVTKSEHPL